MFQTSLDRGNKIFRFRLRIRLAIFEMFLIVNTNRSHERIETSNVAKSTSL